MVVEISDSALEPAANRTLQSVPGVGLVWRCYGHPDILAASSPPVATSKLRVLKARGSAAGAPVTPPDPSTTGSLPIGDAVYPLPTTGGIYVDAVNGDDVRNGTTTALSVKTFQRAYALVAVGGTIVMRAGKYHVGATALSSRPATDDTSANRGFAGYAIQKANVTVQNYPSEAAWFDGSSVYTGWTSDGAGHWYIPWVPFRRDPQYGWVYTGTYPPPVNGTNTQWQALDDLRPFWQFVDYTTFPTAAWPERVFVNGVRIPQVDLLSNLTTGKFFADAYTNRLYLADNPAGKTIEITDLQVGPTFLATGGTIRGVGVRRYAASNPQGAVVKALRQDCTFENMVIEDCGSTGLGLVGSSSNVGANNTVVRNVTVQHCANMGVTGGSTSNVLIDGLLCVENNDARFNHAPSAGGVKLLAQRDCTVKNSLFQGNYGKGLWFDADNYEIQVTSCDFIDNEQRSLVFELSGHIWVTDCYFKGTGADSLRIADCETVQVWNCTFTNSGRLRGSIPDNSGPRVVRYEGHGRGPRSSTNINYGRDSRELAGSIPPWPTPAPLGWMPRQFIMRNCVFGPGNNQSMFGNQDFRTGSGWESYTTEGVNLNSNVYDLRPTIATVQYPFIFGQDGVSTLTIKSDLAGLQSLGFESNGTVSSTTALVDSNGLLLNQSAADVKATALPSNIAAFVGRPTGTKRAGAWR